MKQVDKPEGQIPTVKDKEADVWSVSPSLASSSFYGGNLTLLNQWNNQFSVFYFLIDTAPHSTGLIQLHD